MIQPYVGQIITIILVILGWAFTIGFYKARFDVMSKSISDNAKSLKTHDILFTKIDTVLREIEDHNTRLKALDMCVAGYKKELFSARNELDKLTSVCPERHRWLDTRIGSIHSEWNDAIQSISDLKVLVGKMQSKVEGIHEFVKTRNGNNGKKN